MAAAFVVAERDEFARWARAENETVCGMLHSRKRAGVPCASQWGSDAGCAFFPEGAPGLHGVAIIVRGDATAEPPAHDRLVSGHDPRDSGLSNCTQCNTGDKTKLPIAREFFRARAVVDRSSCQ